MTKLIDKRYGLLAYRWPHGFYRRHRWSSAREGYIGGGVKYLLHRTQLSLVFIFELKFWKTTWTYCFSRYARPRIESIPTQELTP